MWSVKRLLGGAIVKAPLAPWGPWNSPGVSWRFVYEAKNMARGADCIKGNAHKDYCFVGRMHCDSTKAEIAKLSRECRCQGRPMLYKDIRPMS